ncbi:sensor domain-containing protein [Vibrio porteresiae]|uniref:EAL domain-containing protein n=1 Tax=Vibrio porteresiae DSM 19223 TaxID=1123496 RepID=A0ABZ0QHA3_9VIBR|nr:EAL domain-containing protein [Vibrio porteresiae]WPC75820.1 EAL domain-containing protein [Vibrio porteresiae DSM 19223]
MDSYAIEADDCLWMRLGSKPATDQQALIEALLQSSQLALLILVDNAELKNWCTERFSAWLPSIDNQKEQQLIIALAQEASIDFPTSSKVSQPSLAVVLPCDRSSLLHLVSHQEHDFIDVVTLWGNVLLPRSEVASLLVQLSLIDANQEHDAMARLLLERQRRVVQEHVVSESHLQVSERSLRQVTEALPQLMLEFDSHGECFYASQQWQRYTGVCLLGEPHCDWLDTIAFPERQVLIDHWRNPTSATSVECRIRDQSGAYHWFSVRLIPLDDEPNAETKWFGSFTDIESLKQVQLSLEQSQTRVSNIIDTMPEAILLVDENGLIVKANKRSEEVFGYQQNEIEQQPVEMLLPERYRNHHVNLRSQYATQPSIRMMGVGRDLYALDNQGREFPVEVALAPLIEGDRQYAVVSIADITKRKEADAELILAANVFSSTMDGVMILDATRHVVKINSAFEQILGYKNSEIVEKSVSLLRTEKHTKEFYLELWDIARETGRWQGEIWQRHKKGFDTPLWLSLTTIYNHNGQVERFIATVYDISEQLQAQKRIHYLAHYDVLTNLPNRTLFLEQFEQFLTQAKQKGQFMALLFIDLDNFKQVNDTYGHPVGDHLLCQAAERMQAAVSENDIVSRHSGDEFALLLRSVDGVKQASKIAAKICAALAKPFDVGRGDFFISASIGIACYPGDGTDANTLLQHADLAMYRSKERGRNQHHFYDHEMSAQIQERTELQADLRIAIEQDQLVLYYQPVLDILTGDCAGVEALVRWVHPLKGMIPPMKFIPLAEEGPLIHPLGEWVLRRACEQWIAWRDMGLKMGFVSVNVSGKQVMHSDFVGIAEGIFAETGCPANNILVELTESFVMHESELAISRLRQLRNLGLGIAIDDFGTGYSSLSYLKRLPVTKLKLDRSFVNDLPGDANDVAITRAIHRLGEAVGLEVIAEGVETPEQHRFLLDEGFALCQGYLYAKPMSADQLTQFMSQHLNRRNS